MQKNDEEGWKHDAFQHVEDALDGSDVLVTICMRITGLVHRTDPEYDDDLGIDNDVNCSIRFPIVVLWC